MIHVHHLVDGRCEVLEGADAVRSTADEPSRWVQVTKPDDDEIELLVEHFGLHRLSLRDARDVGHPPKLHDFGSHLFFIIHTPVGGDEARTRKIAVFLAKTWVVTLQLFELDVVDTTSDRIKANPVHFLQAPHEIVLALLDQMAVGFEKMTDRLHEHIGKLEDIVVSKPGAETMTAIMRLRREVGWMLRLTRSQRDVCMSLARTTHDAIPAESIPYFRDVFDHVLRVYDMVDGARDGLTAARDSHLTVVNNRLSEIMRTLTIIATVMMPLSLLAGIYGMNFEEDSMPGLKTAWGFWVMMGIMGSVAGYMLWYFRRKGWF